MPSATRSAAANRPRTIRTCSVASSWSTAEPHQDDELRHESLCRLHLDGRTQCRSRPADPGRASSRSPDSSRWPRHSVTDSSSVRSTRSGSAVRCRIDGRGRRHGHRLVRLRGHAAGHGGSRALLYVAGAFNFGAALAPRAAGATGARRCWASMRRAPASCCMSTSAPCWSPAFGIGYVLGGADLARFWPFIAHGSRRQGGVSLHSALAYFVTGNTGPLVIAARHRGCGVRRAVRAPAALARRCMTLRRKTIMKKTVTVFAATGVAGSACVEELLRQQQFNVRVLVRRGGQQEKSSSGADAQQRRQAAAVG